ncbi:GNAT family N-acetyltransferase [Streptococcus suis]|nr:GNAT family N-acetyltransferase [Streptococcus suis]
MIRLEIVDEDNFDEVLAIQLARKDQRRVASVEYSLAQTWLYRDDRLLSPYAILSNQKVVGFLLLSITPENTYFIWRLLIDQRYQNRGYGKEVIQWVLDRAKKDEKCQKIIASYVIGNHKMRYILDKFGFQTIGMVGNEIKMERLVY